MTTDHAVCLNSLNPNSEYVFRLVVSDDEMFVHATKSPFYGFVTKQTKPSVVITSPEENDVVSGTINVMVQASDPVHRFSSNGITKVELEVDGEPCGPPTHTPETNEYVFSVYTALLGSGFHYLRACGTDDFWNESDYMTNISVGSGSGLNAMAVAPKSPSIQSVLSSSSSGGRKKRCADTACKLRPSKSLRNRNNYAKIVIGSLDTSNVGIANDICAEESKRYRSRGLGVDQEEITGKCNEDSHIIAYFLECGICAGYKGFTFVGHGRTMENDNGTGTLLVARERDNRKVEVDVNPSQGEMYLNKLYAQRWTRTPKFLHLYACGSGGASGPYTWYSVLRPRARFYHAYGGTVSFGQMDDDAKSGDYGW